MKRPYITGTGDPKLDFRAGEYGYEFSQKNIVGRSSGESGVPVRNII